MPARSGEFELIARHFAPIAQRDPAALSLKDDAAVFLPPAKHEVVVTTDALVADVHFRSMDEPELIAKKVLRVNLSDLAAMGAKAGGVLLSAGYNRNLSDEWVERFAKGFGEDCTAYGVSLLGGDTVATSGPTFFSLTAFGYVPTGCALRRDRAKPGDVLAVTGTLGDAALGLAALNGKLPYLTSDLADYLKGRYWLPQPRILESERFVASGKRLAAMDISDGLAGDCRKICAASNVGLVINRDAVPLSDAALNVLDHDDTLWEQVLAGGDDYELLITGAPDDVACLGDDVTVIGAVTDEVGVVSLVGTDGKMVELAEGGFDHFK